MEKNKSVSIFAALGKTAVIYLTNLPVLLVLSVICAMPVFGVSYLVIINGSPENPGVLKYLLLMIPAGVLFMLGIVSMVSVYSAAYSGQKPGFGELIFGNYGKLVKLLNSFVIFMALGIMGLMAFILPGLYVMAIYFFIIPAVVLENMETSPFKISREFVRGRFMLIFIIALLMAASGTVMNRFIDPFAMAREPMHYLIYSLACSVITPLYCGFTAIFYLMIKDSKKESFDISMYKGKGQGAGCLMAILAIAGFLAAAVAAGAVIAFISIKNPSFMTKIVSLSSADAVFENGVTLKQDSRWMILKKQGIRESFMLMPREMDKYRGIANFRYMQMPAEGAMESYAAEVAKQETEFSPKTNGGYSVKSVRMMEIGGRNWVEIFLEKNRNLSWKILYTSRGVNVMAVDYLYADFSEKEMKENEEKAEKELLDLVAKIQFPDGAGAEN